MGRVQARPEPRHGVSFLVDGRLVLGLDGGAGMRRPFLYPVLGPAGVPLTRMGHPHDVRDEDQAHVFLRQIQDGTMGNLRGKTKSRMGRQIPPWVHVRQYDLHAELGKERGVQRKQ